MGRSIKPPLPPRPKIVSVSTINCGRLIEVKWEQTSKVAVTGYQVNLISTMDGFKQVFNLSKSNHSIQFDVQSNTDYEVHIRAASLIGPSAWAKKEFQTTAGTV